MIQNDTQHISRKSVLIKAALWAAFLLFIGVGGLCIWLYSYAVTPAPAQSKEKAVVVIPAGSSVKDIGRILDHNKLIHNDIRFLVLVRLMEASSKLRAGEMLISTGKIPVTVIHELMMAVSVQHSVTVPEGYRIEEIGEVFAGKNWCSYERFVELAYDKKFMKSLGYSEITSLEGYLFPDTYYLTKGSTKQDGAERILTMMVRQFEKVWGDIGDEKGGLSKHEVVTLASIVEKETGAAHERAKIAGVFHNRLQKKMKLQSDPTIIYAATDYHGDIKRRHIREKTPYNTYVIPALPPGPICSPGKEALMGVLHPEVHNFLYFVSKNDGTHYFSSTLKEHNRAVYNYQKRRKK